MSKRKKKQPLQMQVPGQQDKLRNKIIIGLILIYTFALFYKSIYFEFVEWDDSYYVTQNMLIRDLSFEGLKKIFTTPVIGMYNPFTFLVYAIEYNFWGLDSRGYHLVNILFHLVATITVYHFIYRLVKRYETAAIVALFFAIHPMHVSVVTWVAQMKTSMFLVFYFLALIKYLRYVQENYKIRHFVYASLFFILSCLAKPSAITLAPMLFLLDYYLSRKIERRLFYEKIPFFLIAVAFGIVTLLTHGEAEDSIFDFNSNYSFINNLLISNYSIAFYIEKLLFPLNLCTIYPYPENDVFLPFRYYATIPIIPLIVWLTLRAGKFKKEMIFGILFFVIAVSVLLRIVPSGFFRAANRYSYLSYTGLFFIMGQYFTYVMDNKFSYAPKIKLYLVVLLIFLVGFFSLRSSVRINVWKHSLTLFDDIIEKKPKLPVAYHNRGVAKRQMNNLEEAAKDFTKAIEFDPGYYSAYNNRGEIKRVLKDEKGAMEDYRKALEINPEYSNSYNNIGIIEFNHGEYDEALYYYNLALKFKPEHGPALHNRATIKLMRGDTTGALEDWKKAAALGVVESLVPLEQFGPPRQKIK